jgi:PHD/YefM family antitoxin component YafN of YafNO toxin-antitoxin module
MDILDILDMGKPMKTFTTVDLNKQIGAVTGAAMTEPVMITHHKRPRFVMMTVEQYESLAQPAAEDKRIAFTLNNIPEDVREGLLALADARERGNATE